MTFWDARSRKMSLADPVRVRASCSILLLESLRSFWKVSKKNRKARLLTQQKPPVTKLAFSEPAQSNWGRLRCMTRVSWEFPAMGPEDPILKQGPRWSMLQERGLTICNLVTKAKFLGVAMEMRLPSWLEEASLSGADTIK